MTRFNRLTVVAIAAAAIAPAAHAAGSPDPGFINVPGVVLTAPPAPFPLPDPAYIVDIPGAGVVPAQAERSPAVQAPKTPTAPGLAKQKGFWGMTATPKGLVHLISDNSPSQNRITLRNLRRLAALHAKHASVPVITDNSPSQNRVASHKAAATRSLASNR